MAFDPHRKPMHRPRPDGRPGSRPQGPPYKKKTTRREVFVPENLAPKVRELQDQWDFPVTIALRIAKGEFPLQAAIEFQARKRSIKKLCQEHGIEGSIAALVIDKKLSIEHALAFHRYHHYKRKTYGRSIFDELERQGEPMVIAMFQEPDRVIVVKKNNKFDFEALSLNADTLELIHKLRIKYAYHPHNLQEIKKLIKTEPSLKPENLLPEYKMIERYQVTDKVLFHLIEQKIVAMFTSLEGDVLRGLIEWFSRYEIGLLLKGGCPVVLFRHAIHHAETKEGKPLEKIKPF